MTDQQLIDLDRVAEQWRHDLAVIGFSVPDPPEAIERWEQDSRSPMRYRSGEWTLVRGDVIAPVFDDANQTAESHGEALCLLCNEVAAHFSLIENQDTVQETLHICHPCSRGLAAKNLLTPTVTVWLFTRLSVRRMFDERVAEMKRPPFAPSVWIPNDRPWMVALEAQFTALSHTRLALTHRQPWVTNNGHTVTIQNERLLRMADCYAFSADVISAIRLASRTIPFESILRDEALPSQAGWWWFDGGFGGRSFRALLWGRGVTTAKHPRPFINFFCYTMSHGALAPGFGFSWEIGESIEHVDTRPEYKNEAAAPLNAEVVATASIARIFLAALSWIQQKVVSSSTMPVQKYRRKQLSSEHSVTPPRDVRVIQLRRSESTTRVAPTDSVSVEWSCRWIVNGHWRNQPYKNDERKLIYILPYVKGPDDKPLKVPTHTVYAVNR